MCRWEMVMASEGVCKTVNLCISVIQHKWVGLFDLHDILYYNFFLLYLLRVDLLRKLNLFVKSLKWKWKLEYKVHNLFLCILIHFKTAFFLSFFFFYIFLSHSCRRVHHIFSVYSNKVWSWNYTCRGCNVFLPVFVGWLVCQKDYTKRLTF